jgi:1-acyl-sn-glycerol-3-phosphate acyltransferase
VLEDILLHEKIGKHGYFLMSSNLPKAFEWLGGVGITRKKDLEKLVKTSPSARLDKLEALKRKREANSEIINLLCRNEVVVVHFEGARHYRERVDPKKHRPNIRNLTDLQALLGRDIPFVPLDICYGNRIVYGTAPPPLSKILLRVGNPIRVVDGAYQELEEHLRNEIEDH